MKNKTILFLILMVCPGLGVVWRKTAADASIIARAGNNALHASVNVNVFDLAAFGAVGDGVTDDGPALQNALNALGESGGGTLFVPAGRYAIITPVQKDFTGVASDIAILGVESLTPVPPPSSKGLELSRGLDLLSEFAPRTGEQAISIKITGLQSFLIKDIGFIGTPSVQTDALITLALNNIREATIRHCEFYGLSSLSEGGAILQGVRSSLNIEQSEFLGSTGNSGVNVPVVQNIEWKAITIADTVFVDYGQREELYGKLGLAPPLSWVNIGNAAVPESDSPRREVVVRNVFFDEGALSGLSSLPYRYLPSSAPIDLLYVTGLYMNVSNLNASGNYLYGPERVLIEDSHYGWSHNADAAVNLLSVGNAILDELECVESANRIRADGATRKLTVINSVYTYLDSQSPTTRVITTETPEDDPVQYVRQQFLNMLGRDPDPAAHFYWSDQILQCGEDMQCVADQRATLDTYLSTAPQPNFSISGQVTDESGAGLRGVTVALGGSQSVTTQTGADGRYIFAGLPTSGVYTVTPAKTSYFFSPANMTFDHMSTNQIADFGAALESVMEFSAASYSVSEGERRIVVTVTRTGNTSSAAEVIYSAIDGSAQQRSDVIPVIGRLSFEPGETSRTFIIFITDDSYVEGDENMTLQLHNSGQVTLGKNSTATLTITDNDNGQPVGNPIDDPQFFVRQHYRDFLNRRPDAEGLAFWSNQIASCGTDAACIADRRMNVSAAFFLSIEFQQTGFLVYRLYQAAFGEPPRHLDEFLLDTRTIGAGVVVNAPGWEQLLEANKAAFLESFVERPQFSEEYPLSLTPNEFVNLLNTRAGGALSPSDVAAAVAEFNGTATSAEPAARSRVLRRVAESETFSQRQMNPAFVLMQYFGYLQRNPDDAPDTNLDGYNFWLRKLEDYGGDFRRAEMVKAFLVSGEYRARFGAP